MILVCKNPACRAVFISKATKRFCGLCKWRKAVHGYSRLPGGADMPNLGLYGAKAGKDFPPLMNAGDVPKPVTYTIAGVEEVTMKGVKKPVASFKETEKRWVINKTNIQALIERYGDVELSGLVGKQVTLASVPTQFQGQNTKGIRVVG